MSSYTRRQMLGAAGAAALAGGAALRRADAAEADDGPVHAHEHGDRDGRYVPVVTPDGSTLPFKVVDGVKEFRVVAEPIEHRFHPRMKGRCWGYNGSTPGPTIEAVEGDRVRMYVTNKLGEHTTIHWHGVLLPNGMDGVGGLTQPQIKPGETWVYEFTLRQHGTQMYHPHADEMVQIAYGMMGLFVIHPREPRPEATRFDRDFAIMLHEWAVHPGTQRPDPSVMLDFNLFTFNGKVFPATSAMTVKTGQRVRIRLGNLSMNEHPIHLHGYTFKVTGTDGGEIPETARWPQTTVPVPVGSTRDIEFVADAPGDWVIHCHKSHHTMNAMGHELPNMTGVDQRTGDLEGRLRKLLPGYMAMGEHGMAEHQAHAEHMAGPANTLPMMMGEGPHGHLEMGGMFSIVKVRDEPPADGSEPGWYEAPEGTRARRVRPG